MNKNLHLFLFLGLILLILYLCRDKIEPFGNQLIVPQFEFAILSPDQDINTGYFQEKICRDDPNWKNGDKTCRDYSLSGADCFEIGNNNKTAFESCLVSCDNCPSSVRIKRRKKREPSPVEDTEEPTYSVFEQSGGEFGTAGGADYRGIINKLDELEEKIQLMNIGVTGSVASNRDILGAELDNIDTEIRRITDELVDFGTCVAKDSSVITCSQPVDDATTCPDNTQHCVFTAAAAGETQGSCGLTSQSDCTAALALDDEGAQCQELRCAYEPPVAVDSRIRTLLSNLTTEMGDLRSDISEGNEETITDIQNLNNILAGISTQLGCFQQVEADIVLQASTDHASFTSAMEAKLQPGVVTVLTPAAEVTESSNFSFTVSSSNQPDILNIITLISRGARSTQPEMISSSIEVTSLTITDITFASQIAGNTETCINFQQHLANIDGSLVTMGEAITTAGTDTTAAITAAGTATGGAITAAGTTTASSTDLATLTGMITTMRDAAPTEYCPYPEPRVGTCDSVGTDGSPAGVMAEAMCVGTCADVSDGSDWPAGAQPQDGSNCVDYCAGDPAALTEDTCVSHCSTGGCSDDPGDGTGSADSVACLAAGGTWTDGDTDNPGATHQDQAACDAENGNDGSVWTERTWTNREFTPRAWTETLPGTIYINTKNQNDVSICTDHQSTDRSIIGNVPPEFCPQKCKCPEGWEVRQHAEFDSSGSGGQVRCEPL